MENLLISPKEVKEKLNSGSNGFMLVDIRDEKEFADWNIKGAVNMPINPLIAEGNYPAIKQQLKTLPKDKFIITICARGINSQVAASVLRDMDYNAAALEKGMKGWNENFDLYKLQFTGFTVIQFNRIGKGCLSYIVYDNSTNEAAIFEPAVFVDEYEDYISANRLKVKYVIDTHSHADHFSGGMELAKKLNTPYYVNAIDVDSGFEFKSLQDIKDLTLGSTKLELFDTPGHTDGSLSFLINNEALICGDLLLLESPGRPDLARTKEATVKGAEILFNTLQNLLPKLNDEVTILPSHFTKVEIRPVAMKLAELKASSKPLTMTNKDEFIDYITSNIPMTPPNYETIKKFNKAGVVIPIDYAEELEIGPNRCAAR